MLEAENEGTTPGGMYIALDSNLVPKPGSCLINRGTPLNDTEALDYNGRHIGALAVRILVLVSIRVNINGYRIFQG